MFVIRFLKALDRMGANLSVLVLYREPLVAGLVVEDFEIVVDVAPIW